MHVQVHVDVQASRVEVTFTGPVSFADRVEVLDQVGPEIVEKQIKGVLVDYSQAWVNEPSVKDYEALASRLRSASYMAGLNVALVNPPEFHAVPTEEVAPRAGFTVRRFASRTSAIAWLERELA
jgi:hypothetical protein